MFINITRPFIDFFGGLFYFPLRTLRDGSRWSTGRFWPTGRNIAHVCAKGYRVCLDDMRGACIWRPGMIFLSSVSKVISHSSQPEHYFTFLPVTFNNNTHTHSKHNVHAQTWRLDCVACHRSVIHYNISLLIRLQAFYSCLVFFSPLPPSNSIINKPHCFK